ncbi:oligosaccharide flippase family protein [Pseudarthrobacter sp. C4D7]|uniref:oligosaccharide flippase family protein n=1 Tax=Pseudarthrobacter sp. C4D7 TaxID=2735268 RepID=UPI0020C81EA3|nr:oligosaccharide flippase family protein [Pseudarthrobacter sp. C4D7]
MTETASRPGASSAFGWSLLNTVLSRLGTLGIGIVLARVLGPESFGTFAVALVALMAVLSFNELGVSLAIVRWPGDPARIVPTVNTISVVGSTVFCGAAIVAAPLFTSAVGDPQATDVIRVLILSVLINGVVASPAALLQRDFREKTRLGIDQVNVWVGALLSLVLALTGMGAMALALGRVAGSLLAAAMFLRASPLPYRLGLDRDLVMPLLRFGLPLAGTSIIFFALGYADQLTTGAVLGSTALGFYVLAFNLSSWPVSILAQPLRRVAPAAFSSLQHDRGRMNALPGAIFSVITCAALPAMLFLVGCAQPLVLLLYGRAWLPSAEVLSWLILAAFTKIFCDLAYDFLVVLGQSGTVFYIQAGSLLVLVPALIAGSKLFGVPGVAAAQALVTGFIVLPSYLRKLHKAGLDTGAIFRGMLVPATVGLAVGGLAWLAASLQPNPVLALVAGGTAAGGGTLWLLYRRRDLVRDLRSVGSAPLRTAAAS